MNRTREERVQEFLDFAGPPTFEVVWACLGEELTELKDAADAYHVVAASEAGEDVLGKYRADFVKEWADVQYVLSQLAIFYDIPGEEAFIRVADNNMTKVQGGEIKRREDGKILKPDNYVKPDMTGL